MESLAMKNLLVFLLIFFFITAFTLSLVWTLLSPGSTTAVTFLIVISILEAPAIILGVFHGLWKPIARTYPEQEHGTDALTKKFQSFSLGIINMGLSIHATVDESFLHLRPVTWLRALGASPMSIPWDEMKRLDKKGRSVILNGGHRLVGPAWCFEMLKATGRDEKIA